MRTAIDRVATGVATGQAWTASGPRLFETGDDATAVDTTPLHYELADAIERRKEERAANATARLIDVDGRAAHGARCAITREERHKS
jgi:hypothetical protein